MDLKRSNEENRAWIERKWLPEGWIINQDGMGHYVKVTDTKDSNRTIFHANGWHTLLAFCEGVSAGVSKKRNASTT